MKKAINHIFAETTVNIMLFLSIVPLFFYHYEYPNYIYILFFIYFLCLQVKELYKQKTTTKDKFWAVVTFFINLTLITPYNKLIVFRLLRLLKILWKNKAFNFVAQIFIEKKEVFRVILLASFVYMLITSGIVFNIEPKTFDYNYWNAFYWSGIMLTTIGYGDVYPITALGKAIGLISGFIGVGIIALPTGIISSTFHEKITQKKKEQN